MSDRSTIEWTDATWNPTRGCSRVSPGCVNCYADREAHRHNHPGAPTKASPNKPRPARGGRGQVRQAGEKLFDPLRWRKPRRIFVNSMSDLFHEALRGAFAVGHLAHVWGVMYEAHWHTFQVLTKRAERMKEILNHNAFVTSIANRAWWRLRERSPEKASVVTVADIVDDLKDNWPLRNVWLGVSVENQEWADQRIPHLLATPAAVRFLSCEPLLGAIDLTAVRMPDDSIADVTRGQLDDEATPDSWHYPAIDWVIAGGESGLGARPMHPDWARSLRDQCAGAEIPFFFKQWGQWLPGDQQPGPGIDAIPPGSIPPSRTRWVSPDGAAKPTGVGQMVRGDALTMRVPKTAAGRLLDGREHNEFPTTAVTPMMERARPRKCLNYFCTQVRRHGQPFCFDCWWEVPSFLRQQISDQTIPLAERRAGVREAAEILRYGRQLPAPNN